MNPTSVKDAEERSTITCFTDEKRLRVYVQNVPVFTGTTRTHVETCVCAMVVRYLGRLFSAPDGHENR